MSSLEVLLLLAGFLLQQQRQQQHQTEPAEQGLLCRFFYCEVQFCSQIIAKQELKKKAEKGIEGEPCIASYKRLTFIY